MDALPQTRAVFFDVDFTLIRPGPAFQGGGYQEFCARYGIDVDASLFDDAVRASSPLLDGGDGAYDPQVFIRYTQRIIEGMGGRGAAVADAAREIYDAWAECRHFELYEDVPDVLHELRTAGLRIGLISNTARCLSSFQTYFALDGLFDVAISSSLHGYMKPHPSIFEAAVKGLGVTAAESVMVGDSLAHDVEGALRLGMRGVLVARSAAPADCPPGVPVIATLRDLPPLL